MAEKDQSYIKKGADTIHQKEGLLSTSSQVTLATDKRAKTTNIPDKPLCKLKEIAPLPAYIETDAIAELVSSNKRLGAESKVHSKLPIYYFFFS